MKNADSDFKAEARRLSKSADMRLDNDESRVSGNNLWAAAVDFLSSSPNKKPGSTEAQETPASGTNSNDTSLSPPKIIVKKRSFLSRFLSKPVDGT